MNTTISMYKTELQNYLDSKEYAKNKKEEVLFKIREQQQLRRELQKELLDSLVNDLIKSLGYNDTVVDLANYITVTFFESNYTTGINCYLRPADFNSEAPLEYEESKTISLAHLLFINVNKNLEFLCDALSTCFEPQYELQMEREVFDESAQNYTEKYYKTLSKLSYEILKQGVEFPKGNTRVQVSLNKKYSVLSMKLLKQTPKQWHIEINDVYNYKRTLKVAKHYLEHKNWLTVGGKLMK